MLHVRYNGVIRRITKLSTLCCKILYESYDWVMSQTRATDQKVEAFSAPIDFLKECREEAARRGMTKSGFYRYALAKELGYTEDDALRLSKFMPLARAQTKSTHLALNETAASSAADRLLKKAAAAVRYPAPASPTPPVAQPTPASVKRSGHKPPAPARGHK